MNLRPRISLKEAALSFYNATVILKQDQQAFNEKVTIYRQLSAEIADIKKKMWLTPTIITQGNLKGKEAECGALIPEINLLERRIKLNVSLVLKYKGVNHRGRYKTVEDVSKLYLPSIAVTRKELEP